MAIMAKSPAEYGIDKVVPEPTQEYDTVALGADTNLPLVGDLIDTPLPELQQLNPSLLRSSAPAGFELKVPKGVGATLTEGLDKIAAERRASWRVHRVQQGETLATIAQKYNSQTRAIVAANTLQDGSPELGDQLLIPAAFRESVASRNTAAKAKTTVARRRAAPKSTVASAKAKPTGPRTAGTIAQVRASRQLAR